MKQCYSMKLDLLTNATVVDDAIKFVSFKDKSSISIDIEKQKHKVLVDNNGLSEKNVDSIITYLMHLEWLWNFIILKVVVEEDH